MNALAKGRTDESNTRFGKPCALKIGGPNGVNVDNIFCGVRIPVDIVCYPLLFHASYSARVNTS